MKFKKIFAGLISLAAATAVTSLVSVGASADWNTKKDETLDPGLSLTTGTWIAQIYNVGSPGNNYTVYDYGLDLSQVAGIRAVFTVDGDPDFGFLFFDGGVGGNIAISTIIAGSDYGDDLYDKYNWPTNEWWGMEYTTDKGEIINTDNNADDDPDNDNPVSAKRIGDHTYELVTDYVNPFVEDGVTEIDCMQVIVQQWGDTLNYYTVNFVEILDGEGNVMLSFDEYGHPNKENIAKPLGDPPSSVSGFTVKSRSGNALRLSWDENASADGYIIEMKEHSKFEKAVNNWTLVTEINNNSATEYRIANLMAGTTYDFRIRAYKLADKVTLYSKYTEIMASTNPSSVSGLKLKARAADALRLTWDENANADGYIIEMKDGSSWTRVGKITSNSTVEFKKSKLKAGTAYTFRVKAYKMSGKTALYSGYTTISARTNPSATTGLKLKARAADAVRLTWTKNTSADGYIIEMKSGSTWTRVGKITNNSTVEFKKSKLKAGTAYTFRVKAYKMSGKTALYGATKTISVRTNPSAVSGLKLKNSAKDAVRLSWTKNTSADGYIIEMKVNGVWKRAGKLKDNSVVEFNKYQLKAGTTYTFRVKTYKMSGKTALYSATKTITVKTK